MLHDFGGVGTGPSYWEGGLVLNSSQMHYRMFCKTRMYQQSRDLTREHAKHVPTDVSGFFVASDHSQGLGSFCVRCGLLVHWPRSVLATSAVLSTQIAGRLPK